MAEDLTRSVTVKRKTNKTSGYLVEEQEGEYFISEAPSKARVNEGDKVVGINGIRADEFEDEEDANDLIESIRIVVVPEENLEEYDGLVAGGGGSDQVFHCAECGHDNYNLERDEDGDYVCEECGHVIPEDGAVVLHEEDRRKLEYECPDCGHITFDPQPDHEGDRICEECGCILAEKVIVVCDSCGKENVDPVQDEDGDYVCEACGEILDIELVEEKMSAADKLKAMNDAAGEPAEGGGQQFGADGRPITNAQGKKLTPADMFKPGDVITVTVGKSNPKQDAGLKVEERNGKYYVRKVPSSGLFARTPVIAGDKILEMNGTDSHDFKHVNELKVLLKEEERITIVVLRKDPEASESSASSVDYDNLAPVTPDGVAGGDIEERDDDTTGYDGERCVCVWCPECNP